MPTHAGLDAELEAGVGTEGPALEPPGIAEADAARGPESVLVVGVPDVSALVVERVVEHHGDVHVGALPLFGLVRRGLSLLGRAVGVSCRVQGDTGTNPVLLGHGLHLGHALAEIGDAHAELLERDEDHGVGLERPDLELVALQGVEAQVGAVVALAESTAEHAMVGLHLAVVPVGTVVGLDSALELGGVVHQTRVAVAERAVALVLDVGHDLLVAVLDDDDLLAPLGVVFHVLARLNQAIGVGLLRGKSHDGEAGHQTGQGDQIPHVSSSFSCAGPFVRLRCWRSSLGCGEDLGFSVAQLWLLFSYLSFFQPV